MSEFLDAYRKESDAREREEADRAARDRRIEDSVRDLADALKREERQLLELKVEVSIGWCGTAEIWNHREYGSLEEKIDQRSLNRWVCAIRTKSGRLYLTHDGIRFWQLWTDMTCSPIADTVSQTVTWIAQQLARGLPPMGTICRLGMSQPEAVISLGWRRPRYPIEFQ